MINKKQNYFILKETIRAKYNQLSHTERGRLIEHGKKIGKIEVLFNFQCGHFSSEKTISQMYRSPFLFFRAKPFDQYDFYKFILLIL